MTAGSLLQAMKPLTLPRLTAKSKVGVAIIAIAVALSAGAMPQIRQYFSGSPQKPPEPTQPPGTIKISRCLVPYDIAKIALADIQQFAPEDAVFQRYIFLPKPTDEYVQAVNFTVNAALSSATLIQYGFLIHPQCIRYDLRFLAPDSIADLQALINAFEELGFDPYFHEFVSVEDTVDISREQAVDALKIFLAVVDADKQQLAISKNKDVQEAAALFATAKLQEQLSNLRNFDLVFFKAFVAQADKVLAGFVKADGTPAKLSEQFLAALKNLRDAIDNLQKLDATIANVEVQSRHSGQGALGINTEVPIPARHAGEALEILTEIAQSDAVLTRADFFIVRALASIDIGYGSGLIYQFYNVRAGQNGKTDFEQLLIDFGGVSLEEIARLRSDADSAVFTSFVTARTRKAILIPSLGVAKTRGAGMISYTQDPADEQSAAQNEPMRNLNGFTFAAQEVIYEGKNGILRWDLFNAAGVRQNSAPDSVVRDNQIPAPWTNRLYSGMSCIRCHGPQGGHMSIGNDVKRLTSAGVDILDDLASADGLFSQQDRFAGQFALLFEKPLQISRDYYSDAAFRSTAGILIGDIYNPQIKPMKGRTAAEIAAILAKINADFAYTFITPKIALSELGYFVDDEHESVELLRQVSPDVHPVDGIVFLDVTLSGLKIPSQITRPSWNLVYFEAMLNSMFTAKTIAEGEIRGEQVLAIQAQQRQRTALNEFIAKRRAERSKAYVAIPKAHPSLVKPRQQVKSAVPPTQYKRGQKPKPPMKSPEKTAPDGAKTKAGG